MIDGRIRQTGTPAEVYGHPQDRAVAEFLGDANFLAGEVRGGSVECELGTLPVLADFEGGAEVLVRAEASALAGAVRSRGDENALVTIREGWEFDAAMGRGDTADLPVVVPGTPENRLALGSGVREETTSVDGSGRQLCRTA